MIYFFAGKQRIQVVRRSRSCIRMRIQGLWNMLGVQVVRKYRILFVQIVWRSRINLRCQGRIYLKDFLIPFQKHYLLNPFHLIRTFFNVCRYRRKCIYILLLYPSPLLTTPFLLTVLKVAKFTTIYGTGRPP